MMGLVRDDPTFLQRCLSRSEPYDSQSRKRRPSVLCIGVGGGSLPLFMSYHFPGVRVEAVDLDPAVLTAASEAMGFPLDRCPCMTWIPLSSILLSGSSLYSPLGAK